MSDDEMERVLAAFDQRTQAEAAAAAAQADRLAHLRDRFEAMRSDLIHGELQRVANQLIDHGHIAGVHDGGSGSIGPFVELTTTRMGRPEPLDGRLTYRFLLEDGRVSIESMVGDDEQRSICEVDDVSAETIRSHAVDVVTRLLA